MLVTLWKQPLLSSWPSEHAVHPTLAMMLVDAHAHCRNAGRGMVTNGGAVEAFHDEWIAAVAYSRN